MSTKLQGTNDEMCEKMHSRNSRVLKRYADELNHSAQVLGHERLEVQARKFYSQRNMYLCGFTLFLSLILNRTYVMILEVMRLEDKLKQYEGTSKNTKESEKLAVAGKPGELAGLKEKLAKKEQDLDNLKKQSEQLNKSYNELSDKYAATQPNEGKKGK